MLLQMRRYYYEVCDKIINSKSKEKHLFSKSHKYLSMSVVNRYYAKNTELVKIKETMQKLFDEYNINFGCYQLLCEGKFHFPDGHNTNGKRINIKNIRCYYRVDKIFRLMTGSDLLEQYFKREIEYLNRRGLELSHISEKNITTITELRFMT